MYNQTNYIGSSPLFKTLENGLSLLKDKLNIFYQSFYRTLNFIDSKQTHSFSSTTNSEKTTKFMDDNNIKVISFEVLRGRNFINKLVILDGDISVYDLKTMIPKIGLCYKLERIDSSRDRIPSNYVPISNFFNKGVINAG